MPRALLIFLAAAVALRLLSLAWSVKNERALKAAGGTEYGARNSAFLAFAHLAIYGAAPVESAWRGWPDGSATLAGILLYGFGMAWLAVVIALLGRLWTVKLILARDHRLITHPLFRHVHHPNYFLAIVPELAGYAIAFHAWVTLVVGLLVYAIPLGLRIREEQIVMRDRFAAYAR